MSRHSIAISLSLTILLIVGFLVLGGCESSAKVSPALVPGDDAAESSSSSTSEEAVDVTTEESSDSAVGLTLWEDGWLVGVPLSRESEGWTISRVTSKLGEPDRAQLPDLTEDPSPNGQWFRWDLADGDFTLSLLANAYDDKTADYGSAYFVSALRRNGDAVSGAVIEGLSLGESALADVESLYGDDLEVSGMADRWNIDETGTAVSCVFRGEAGVSADSGINTYYFFDKDDVLVGIAQTTGYLDGID